MSDKTNGKGLVPAGKASLVPHGREGNKLIRRAASDALVPRGLMPGSAGSYAYALWSRGRPTI